MLTIVFLFVFGQYVSGQSSSCYQDCKKMAYYKCNICYESCSPFVQVSNNKIEEYPFTLKQCTFTYCALSNYKNTQCLRYESVDLSENDCIKKCCDEPNYNTFTNQTFNQCIIKNEQLQQKFSKTLMIVGIVFGSIFFIIIFVGTLICFGIYTKVKNFLKSCTQRFKSNTTMNQSNNQSGIIIGNSLPHLQVPINLNKKQKYTKNHKEIFSQQNLIWNEIQVDLKQNDEQYCSICLDENMNCQTSCGHKYHFACLRQWTKNNPTCPICKNQSFNRLKLFCRKCAKYETTYHLKINSDKKTSSLFKKIICSQCSKFKQKVILPKLIKIKNQD